MMTKNFISSAIKTLLTASSKPAGTHHDQLLSKAMMTTSFSSQVIHHSTGTPTVRTDQPGPTGQTSVHDNRVDAPFAGVEPKLTRQVPVEGPDQDSSYDNKTQGDHRKSKTEGMTDYVTDKAKKETKGVVETAFDVGAAVAEGMEKTWGGVKETTHKVKNTVLGNSHEDRDDRGRREGDGGDSGKVDKHVEDLRKKAGGYDVRSQ